VRRPGVRPLRDILSRFAAAVPDFWIWAQLDEHAATRTTVQSHLRAILDGQITTLLRLEALLATTTGPASADRRRDALWRANRMLLEQPIVRWSDTASHGSRNHLT
jgi:hypothetical protein